MKFRYAPVDALPHGPDMVLLDDILAWSEESARCSLTIRPESRFFETGRGIPGWVAIEYMAQCIGVWDGVRRLDAGTPVMLGLLLGTRSYEISNDWFAEGQYLEVTAELLVRDSTGVAVFACGLGDGKDVWAKADIKAYQPDDIAGYLKSLEET